MKNYDTYQHVLGTSKFLDDFATQEGTLHIAIVTSPSAHGKITSIDYSQALKIKGVVRIITAIDIPGENQIGGIIADEPLLAENEVHFIGQPIALILADNFFVAKKAVSKVKINIEALPVITNPRIAFEKGNLIIPPRIFSSGDLENAWSNCDYIFDGTAETGGQEHLYLETQGAYAQQSEGNAIKIFSSTQGTTQVQRCAARVLGLSMNQVEVETGRIGGGFGGKEDQANAYGAMAALAAKISGRPCKIVLSREDDMKITGKRHPYIIDYKIGLTKNLKIQAFEVTFFQNAGASADLSTPVLDRTLFHANNSYFIPNLKATGLCCRTNLPPNTAFRGFGGPQGMFSIETAIHHAAGELGVAAQEIQKKNLLNENDQFHYGQLAKECNVGRCWEGVHREFNIDEVSKEIDIFNSKNKIIKKGIAIMPICFGISFTNTFMNQASALVHVYSDGSIVISTGAVEMGQGVNMKIRLVASKIFGVNLDRIRIDSTNTGRTANTSPTAASSGADLNGKASEIACNDIKSRLLSFASKLLNAEITDVIDLKNELVFLNGFATKLTWVELVNTSFFNRVNLSSHANYAVPNIFFDKIANKGDAFGYHTYGCAAITVTLDCILGTYKTDSVNIVHDFGSSFAENIDKGQAEGALMQGIGWVTMEEIIFNQDGKLLTDSLSTYKIPDIYSSPGEVNIKFLENSINKQGIFNSKAIGEPPLMYGIAAFFALQNAMKAFKPAKKLSYISPLMPERVLMWLWNE